MAVDLERKRAKNRARAKANPDKMRAAQASWRERNPHYGKQYMAIYRKAEYERNAIDIRALKLLRGCADCGYDADARGLQFDHVRGAKTEPVASLVGSLPALRREIPKCDVRCGTCHAIRTEERRSA